jgi:hypothetical protein
VIPGSGLLTALGMALALAAASTAPGPVARSNPAPTASADPQEILLDLRMGRAARRLVPALSRDGEALLPAREFLELAELRSAGSGEELRAVRQPGNVVVSFRGEGVLLHEDRLYASTAWLERAFDLTIQVDWEELSAVVMDIGHLPLGLRVARENRWNAFRPPTTGSRAPADRTLGTTPYRAGGLVVDWALSSSASDPESSAAGSLAVGGQLLGGSLQLSARSVGPLAAGEQHLAGSYHVAWPRQRIVRQFRLGDGVVSGPRPRTLLGVHLTNAPFVRDNFFGMENFEGRLGPGWEVELRQSGQTVDLRRADEQGAFALDIPVRYGENPLEVIGYGPHGEVVTMDRLLLMRSDRLPQGHLEWGLGAGACRVASCEAAGNLDLRYGLTRRWTLRGGVEGVQRDSVGDAVLPYLELTGAPVTPLNLSAEWLGGASVRGTAFFTPSSAFRLRAAYTRFSADSSRAVFHDPMRQATLEVDAFVRPLAKLSAWSLTGSLVQEDRLDFQSLRTRALTTLAHPRLRVEGGVQVADFTTHATGVSRREITPLVSVAGAMPWLGRGVNAPWFRVDAEFLESGNVHRLNGRIGRNLGPSGRLEVGAGWGRTLGSRVSATFSADLPMLRSVSQWFAPEGETGDLVQYIHGTVQWDEASGRLRAGAMPALERAGVSGAVFLDENGNGIRDAGEPGVPDVRVMVEGRTVTTDAEGRYSADNLVPFEATRISIHAPSIPNPTWLPLHGVIDIPLAPSSFRRLDLPLQRTGEVSGRVVRVDGAHPAGESGVSGAEILLIDLGPGGRIHETTTFSDGGFYLMGIPPGGYELRLTPGILNGLGLSPDHPRRNVVIEPTGSSSTRNLVIRLLPIDPT